MKTVFVDNTVNFNDCGVFMANLVTNIVRIRTQAYHD